MAEQEQVSAFEFEGWAILELMGHRKLGGYVRLNGPLIRIDVHDEKQPVMTQWYGAHSLYCMTPTTEAVAKRLSQTISRAAPVTKYELQLPSAHIVPSYQDNDLIEDDDL
ncbi:MAG TPA: hypothetical protein VKS22_13200 [Candidatus Binataceae bacterium]|nr:hypothetical protein [Candidatus Binataceae bacterium]